MTSLVERRIVPQEIPVIPPQSGTQDTTHVELDQSTKCPVCGTFMPPTDTMCDVCGYSIK